VFLQSSIGYFAGKHDLKLGYQFDYAWNEVINFTVRYAGSHRLACGFGEHLQHADRRDSENIQQARHPGQWTPLRKLTMNLGLRLDTNVGWQRVLPAR
jgi:hypothetical protein